MVLEIKFWSVNCTFVAGICKNKASKKCKYIKAIYIYTSEESRYRLSENGIVYYALT